MIVIFSVRFLLCKGKETRVGGGGEGGGQEDGEKEEEEKWFQF